jgi:hypothetical protein
MAKPSREGSQGEEMEVGCARPTGGPVAETPGELTSKGTSSTDRVPGSCGARAGVSEYE